MRTGVLVAGFFDLLHSGHVCFLERAAEYGPLTVVIGSDQNALQAKGRLPLCTEEERLYMVQSLRVVQRAVLAPELGRLNFAETMRSSKPQYFVTNSDGHHESKVELCRELGVEYVVLQRDPHEGLPVRSTTAWRSQMPNYPYKVALLGGFVDQPAIGRVCPGSVVVVSVETGVELEQRSGVATSTRDTAIGLFGPRYPAWMTPQRLAEIIFACENPPDRQYLSGTIDVLGLFQPGLSRLDYANGGFWPADTENVHDTRTLHWLEKHLWLVQTQPRPAAMPSPMDTACPTAANIQRMNQAVQLGFQAIRQTDLETLGRAVSASYQAMAAFIPQFAPPEVDRVVQRLQAQYPGAGLTGAGGGGYAVVISVDQPVDGIPVRIVRADESAAATVAASLRPAR